MTTRERGSRPRPALLRGGRIHGPAGPATAMVVVDGRIAWLGDGSAPEAAGEPGSALDVVELRGALVTAAFVDAHVHTTTTGLALTGLDLHGTGSLAETLDRLAGYVRGAPTGPVLGAGWDQTDWPERRPPTGAELARATGGREVYLARVDAHSGVCSPSLLAAVDGVESAEGWRGDGLVERDAHHLVRRHVFTAFPDDAREAAQDTALRYAASRGVGCVHEMSGPDIAGGEPDLLALLALAGRRRGPEVVPYWGGLHEVETARRLGCRGAAGDLFADGSVGSRTAALRSPYADAPGRGHAYLSAEEAAAHVVACTRGGLQAGFHAIGDAALDAVTTGLRLAAGEVGVPAVRAARHRVEHAELLDAAMVATFASLGVVASVQPAFDAAWGGGEGMYAQRLGRGRAAAMNPYADLHAAGVTLAFGSDSPVTPIDPWAGVRAAVLHRTPGQRLPLDVAFAAHTVGGRLAAGEDEVGAGVLRVGAPATYAVWDTAALPSAPGSVLPELAAGAPTCLATVVRGIPVHGRLPHGGAPSGWRDD